MSLIIYKYFVPFNTTYQNVTCFDTLLFECCFFFSFFNVPNYETGSIDIEYFQHKLETSDNVIFFLLFYDFFHTM